MNVFVLLYLSEGSSSQSIFSLISGTAARLYEKHEGISKQANPHSLPSSTRFEPMLVIFRYEYSSCLKLIKDTPSGDLPVRPSLKRVQLSVMVSC